VDYKDFIALVTEHSDLSTARAEKATDATLRTLSERLEDSDRQALSETVPQELQGALITQSPAERFDVGEFVRRVGEREAQATEQYPEKAGAEADARAILSTLSRFGSSAKALAALSKDYDAILTPDTDNY
jgi:uncharacterized protein (DUF2267 family)